MASGGSRDESLELTSESRGPSQAQQVGSRERWLGAENKELGGGDRAVLWCSIDEPDALNLRVQLREEDRTPRHPELQALDSFTMFPLGLLSIVEGGDGVVQELRLGSIKRVDRVPR